VSDIVVAAFFFAMRPSFRLGRVNEVLPRSGNTMHSCAWSGG